MLLVPFVRRSSCLARHIVVGSRMPVLATARRMSAPSDAASAKVSALCDELCTLNVIEMNQLVSLFKEKVGLKGVDLMPQSAAPSAPVAAAPAASAPVKEEPKVAAKENFDVKLVSFSADDKIKVIKEVRAVTGLGLKEAKDLVEGAPKVMKKGVTKADADAIVAKLKAVGAVVAME